MEIANREITDRKNEPLTPSPRFTKPGDNKLEK
jgi:hypothetical protein